MKLCKDCRHYDGWNCRHSSNVEVYQSRVDGRQTVTTRCFPTAMRADPKLCGPNATLFEPHVTFRQWCAKLLLRALRAVNGKEVSDA